MSTSKYEQFGASASKSGLHNALKSAGIKEQSGLFAGINADFAGSDEFASFLHCDGAGTKTIVCYLLYKALGDPKVFKGLAQDALVMNLDDVFCLGVPESLLISNMIARNAKLIGHDIIGVLIESYKQLVGQLEEMGINIELGGGETADCGDVVRTLMVDAVLAGRIARKNIIDNNRIVPGDVIVGISNTGRASYESTPNSSIGSNGLTLARHAMLNRRNVEQFSEVGDPSLSAGYSGPFLVTDEPEGLEMSVGEALSSPTRTYAPVLLKLYKELGNEVHGCIHNTGGGQTKVLRFGKGNIYIKDNLFPAPKLFQLIQEHGKVDPREMYQVFNMGHRMELYVEAKHAGAICDAAKSFGLEAQQVGHVEKNPSSDVANEVVVKTTQAEHRYTL